MPKDTSSKPVQAHLSAQGELTSFISGRELVAGLGIMDFQLFDFVKAGLQPYTMTGEPLESLAFRQLKILGGDIEHLRGCSWKEYKLPEGEKARRRDIDELLNSLYRKSDLSEFSECAGLFPEERGEETTETKTETEQPIEPEPKFLFAKTGPTWKIVWQGWKTSGLTGKGFACLHHLVEHPGRSFSTVEIVAAIGDLHSAAVSEYRRMEAYNEVLDGNLSEKQDKYPKADIEAIQECKDKVKSLEEQEREARENGQDSLAEKHRAEREEIEDYLLNSQKYFRGDLDKEFNRISKALKRAIDQLKERDKECAVHFRKATHPLSKNDIAYRPSQVPPWDLPR